MPSSSFQTVPVTRAVTGVLRIGFVRVVGFLLGVVVAEAVGVSEGRRRRPQLIVSSAQVSLTISPEFLEGVKVLPIERSAKDRYLLLVISSSENGSLK